MHTPSAGRRGMLMYAALTALLVLGATVAGLAVIPGTTVARSGRSAPALLVRGQRESFQTSLSDSVHVEGRLYPALPGVNSLDLRIYGLPTASSPMSLQLRAVMPGMAMQPIRASLVSATGRFRGAITLPMFGNYVASVILVRAQARWQGSLTIAVPLILTH